MGFGVRRRHILVGEQGVIGVGKDRMASAQDPSGQSVRVMRTMTCSSSGEAVRTPSTAAAMAPADGARRPFW